MPKTKRDSDTVQWIQILDETFPVKQVLTKAEVGKLLGYGETQTKNWLEEMKAPYVIMGGPSSRQKRKCYIKVAIAEILAKQTRRQ